MTAAERQEILVEDYLLIEDHRERFQYLVDSGSTAGGLEPEERREENLVPGCVSRTWLSLLPEPAGGLRVRIDSESPALHGIAALYTKVYSGASPAEIVGTEPTFLERLGIDRHLTPTRLRGLRRLREMIVERASAFLEAKE